MFFFIVCAALFLLYTWLKNKWLARKTQPQSQAANDVPDFFLDGKSSPSWEERLKKKEEDVKKYGKQHSMDFIDEAILRHELREKYNTHDLNGSPFMGAFERADLIRKRREARMNMTKELRQKMQEHEDKVQTDPHKSNGIDNDYTQ